MPDTAIDPGRTAVRKGQKPLSARGLCSRQARNMTSRRMRREPPRLKQSKGGGKKPPREGKWEPHGEAF